MTLRDDYVMALEAENEHLRDRVTQLEETLGVRLEVPLVLQLTSQEAKIFGVLFKREMVTREVTMDVLYGNRPDADEPEIKIVDVFVSKMRKKLKAFEIGVETVRGRGYRMNAQSKANAAALLEQARVS